MKDIPFSIDVGIVGLGRVGLPLALSFVEKGLKVLGIERFDKELESLRQGKMPFTEPGYDELTASKKLQVTTEHSRLSEVEHIIITVGTPLRQHIETDLSQVMGVIDTIIPFLRKGHTLILRSTVAPRTTRTIGRYIEQKTILRIGQDFFLAFCPERLAGGKAKIELATLPQIIGTEDAKSGEKAEKLFSRLGPKCFHTDYVTAELTKLFCNIYRYVNFAIANHLAVIADHYDTNIYDILTLANEDYPRSQIPSPGMAAGACLRKDFGMISEDHPYCDLFLSAWRVNEYTPLFLIHKLKQRTTIHNKSIAVLGATFKRDSDDIRDSLIPKLIRYLEREVPSSIVVHEPHLGASIEDAREHFLYPNTERDQALHEANIVFLAINHSIFAHEFEAIYSTISTGAWIVDIWNVSKTNQIFFQKS